MQFMQYIKKLLFGVRQTPVEPMVTTLHTVLPTEQPSETEWFNEFKVSSQHGKQSFYF